METTKDTKDTREAMLNNFVMPDLYPAAPEIFLLLMSFLVLFVDLVFGTTHRWMAAMLTVVTLLGCAALTLVTLDGQSTLTFSGMFVDDLLSDFLKLLTYFAVIMMLIYFLRLEHFVGFDRKQLVFHLETWKRILRVGLPAGGEFALMFVFMAVSVCVLPPPNWVARLNTALVSVRSPERRRMTWLARVERFLVR